MRHLIFLSLLLLFSCKTQNVNHLADIDGTYLYLNKEEKEIDADMEAMIAPYRKELSKKMDVVLIQNKKALKKGKPNCTMGMWIADLLFDYLNESGLNVDFAVQNYGGLRVNEVGVGAITVGNIFEVMPFENMLVVLETDAEMLQTFCDHLAAGGGWPVSKGIRFSIDKDGKATDIEIGGEALDMTRKYRFGVPDYIANGGSDCAFFKGLDHENSGKLIREIILEDTRMRGEAGEVLNIELEKRIK